MTSLLTENLNKILLIKEFLMYKKYFSKFGLSNMESFNMMIMFERVESDTTDDTWEGTVLSIKKHVTQQMQDLRTKLYAKIA